MFGLNYRRMQSQFQRSEFFLSHLPRSTHQIQLHRSMFCCFKKEKNDDDFNVEANLCFVHAECQSCVPFRCFVRVSCVIMKNTMRSFLFYMLGKLSFA
jgi:hypothetical protein